MRNIIVLLICMAFGQDLEAETTSVVPASNSAEDVLSTYFHVLHSRNYEALGSIMDMQSMAGLKQFMDDAIRQQARRGDYGLQRRVFGKKVSMRKVDAATAEFYLSRLAQEILAAAESQHFVVDNQEVLGRVEEGDDKVHYVARVTMSQNGNTASNIRIYTLIREHDGWKLAFPDTIKQMLQVIEASVVQQVRR